MPGLRGKDLKTPRSSPPHDSIEHGRELPAGVINASARATCYDEGSQEVHKGPGDPRTRELEKSPANWRDRCSSLAKAVSSNMYLYSILVVVAAFVASALGKSASSTSKYVEPSVPTGTPIPGNYTGQWRPQLHFSPPKDFMNDPNGMFLDSNGTFHLYYQYDPTATVAGNQHWGHATSADLYHWVNQPIAIFPPDSTHFIYSGSAVVDVNNTSGFFPDQDNGVVAIYTIAEFTTVSGPQVQAISYSKDGGYTFTPYADNPIITDHGSNEFRDPKVIWHAPTQKWVLVVAYSSAFTIGIYTSDNLRQWTHASNFSHHGLLGLQYECPNMVEIPMEGASDPMYVLMISINPGAPLGGSISQYFPGTFNGTHFTAVDAAARIADFGKDNYAGQFFYGIPGTDHQVSIAWASNWQYAQQVPTGPQEGWRSAMSLPRHNHLKNITAVGYDLVSAPIPFDPVLESQLAEKTMGNDSLLLDFSSVASNALYLDINVTSIPSVNVSGTSTLNITFSSSVTGESLQCGFFIGDQTFWLNRGKLLGFDNVYFTDKMSTSHPLNTTSGTFRLSAVIDRSLFEVFLDGGDRSATVSIFPESPLDTLLVKSIGLNPGVQVKAEVWALKSTWAEEANKAGTVVGNVTKQTVKRDRAGEGGKWYY